LGLGEGDFVIVDGTLIPTDRIKADEPYYSQKHKQHGMNVQVIAAPDGTPLWFSRATPGRTHDLTAARAHGIVQACLTRQILGNPHRPVTYHRRLQRVFYTSALVSVRYDPNSRKFYDRKRAEGKKHIQAVLAWPADASTSSGH
jgi:hypothetical protein